MSLPRLSTRRPVAVAMLWLMVVLLGAVSLVRLPLDLLPEMQDPRIVIRTLYPHAAPTEVERLISEPLEAHGASVAGVERVSSISRAGMSLVTLHFPRGTEMDFATLTVRERIDRLRNVLPPSASRPTLLRVDPDAEPIVVLGVTGSADLRRTTELVETVFRRRLEQIEGVARARVIGGLDREIAVEVDPRLLEAHGLTLDVVSRALRAASAAAPGGTILKGRNRYPLRIRGGLRSVEGIRGVAVGRVGSGRTRPVRLDEVATVQETYSRQNALARFDGEDAVGILVFDAPGSNTLGVTREVEKVAAELETEHPGIRLRVASSQADFLSASISSVVQALVLGGTLAFLVLFLFLKDPRHPGAVSIAIPVSVMGSFTLMELTGVSLNVMSLGGLALGVGLLVDNSIVVLENLSRRREAGIEDGPEAAAAGAEEVRGAIAASTLTTIAVFGPVAAVEGVAGELFGDLSLSVVFSLLVSFLVAMTLLPAMAARSSMARAAAGRGGTFPAQLAEAFDRAYRRFAAGYDGALSWALDHRARVLVVAAGLVVAGAASGWRLDRSLLPRLGGERIRVAVSLPEGTLLEATARAVGILEKALLSDPFVDAVWSRIGLDGGGFGEDRQFGSGDALLEVRLRPGVSAKEALGRLSTLARSLSPDAVRFESEGPVPAGRIPGSEGADLVVRIRGRDLEAAHAYARAVRRRLARLEGLGEPWVSVEGVRPRLEVDVLQGAAARLGIAPRTVAEALERTVRGERAAELVDFDRRIGVVVRLPDSVRHSTAVLDEARVEGVPLRALVRVRESSAPVEIRREDRSRVVPVRVKVRSGGVEAAAAAIETALEDVAPPAGLVVEVGGGREEVRRSFRDLAVALGLSVVLVYMILAAQFESLLHPLSILAAVPMALVGAVAALAITGEGLNAMSLIGMVILVGIVVNDAIVKVDFVRRGRAAGLGVRTAILEAGRVRLRPIVMTTVTSVLGLAPMAVGIGRGSELRAPLAIAVIGGLLAASLLTLIVVPVICSLAEEAGGRRGVR